jgi:hypothetical protein
MDTSARTAPIWQGRRRKHRARSWLLPIAAAATLLLTAYGATVVAADDAAVLPPSWHIHDGQTALGSQHKGVGFFPRILGITTAEYLLDPASCPNATDKSFLPSFGERQAMSLRNGECRTSTVIIHLQTLPVGSDGPEGWSSLTTPAEPGFVTFYLVTQI